jgi:hypothetical protein
VTKDRIYRLQLLLLLASAVILESETCGAYDHILLTQIRDSPNWKARFPYLYPLGTVWPSYTPRHGGPFSSSPTTCRDTVEVFEPTGYSGLFITCNYSLLHRLESDCIENSASNISSFVACLFVTSQWLACLMT